MDIPFIQSRFAVFSFCVKNYYLENLLINRLLPSAFVLVNGIVFNRSNGLMIKCLIIACLLKEVKYFKKITDFKSLK